MALHLNIEVLGEEIVNRRLLRFAARANDMRPAWLAIATLLEKATLERFQTQGNFGGEPWAPLAASTIRQKERKGTAGNGILVDSGRLRASLTQEGGGDSVRVMTPAMLVWGTTVPYGRFHQTGTSRMPQRRVVKLPEPVKVAIVKELQKVLVEL